MENSTIQEKLDKLLKLQEKTLTKQEIMNVRSMNTEELLDKIVVEQKKMRREFDRLYTSWGWDVEKMSVM